MKVVRRRGLRQQATTRAIGRIVSRNTILDRVWDCDFDPHTNIVESRVCHLREKIDRPFPLKLLRTVRKFGYVLG